MADFMDIIRGRRSVRSFTDAPVPEELLEEVLEAGRWAQSWANSQCWEVVVVKDDAVKAELQKTTPEGNPSLNAVGSAPVVLALCGRKEKSGYYKGGPATKFGDWMLFDLGIFAENMALAAHALGLGSVILGLFDQDAGKKVLNLPEDTELAALMPMGYPNKESKAPPRREISDFTHQNRFRE
jgi:nitroreductase